MLPSWCRGSIWIWAQKRRRTGRGFRACSAACVCVCVCALASVSEEPTEEPFSRRRTSHANGSPRSRGIREYCDIFASIPENHRKAINGVKCEQQYFGEKKTNKKGATKKNERERQANIFGSTREKCVVFFRSIGDRGLANRRPLDHHPRRHSPKMKQPSTTTHLGRLAVLTLCLAACGEWTHNCRLSRFTSNDEGGTTASSDERNSVARWNAHVGIHRFHVAIGNAPSLSDRFGRMFPILFLKGRYCPSS